MLGSLVKDGADIGVLDADIQALLQREVVELVVNIVGVLNVLLKADDGKALECLGFVHHGIQTVRIVECARYWIIRISSRRGLSLLVVILVATGGLLLEIRRFKNLWFFEHLGLDCIGIQLDVQAPLLDLFGLGYHLVELLDGVDSVLRLLEQALAHLGHGLLVFANFLGDADEHGELGRQVDVLALLLDFEQRLIHLPNLHVVLLFEVAGHGDGGSSLALLEVAGLGAHVEAHIADLVGLVVAIHSHDDGAFELVNDRLLELALLWRVVVVALALLTEALNLIVNQLEAVVNGQILADIVNDQVEAALENPGRGEEARPSLDGAVKGLSF